MAALFPSDAVKEGSHFALLDDRRPAPRCGRHSPAWQHCKRSL